MKIRTQTRDDMQDADEADYVIVGAGPAGCALAARLAASPGKPVVALVEAGRPGPSLLSRVPVGVAALVPWRNPFNYGFHTVPQPHLGGRPGICAARAWRRWVEPDQRDDLYAGPARGL